MFLKNYTFTVNNLLDSNVNLHNIFVNNASQKTPYLTTVFSTFGSEKDLKFVRLYILLFSLTGQRPILRKFKFNHIKKKILKNFKISVNLSRRSNQNFTIYLSEFYLYFFQIFYQKNLINKCNPSNFNYYFDNIQQFIKNYGKHGQKSRIRYQLPFSTSSSSLMLKYMFNLFLVRPINIKKLKK